MRFPYIPQGEACNQHPNFREPRGCRLQASLKTNLGDFASHAYIAPVIYIEGVRPPLIYYIVFFTWLRIHVGIEQYSTTLLLPSSFSLPRTNKKHPQMAT